MMLQTGLKSHQVQDRGFTLLELIFVVLIISVLVGLSTPMFKDTFNNMQFNQSCSDLSSALNFARQSAILNRSEYRLKLDSGEGRFWIEENVLEEPGIVFKKLTGRFGKVYYLPKGINIESNSEYLTFYPDGRSDTATITIKSNVIQRIFTTEGTAGYVKIK